MTCERTTGFEPATSTLARWCSSQLSYVRMLKKLGAICLGPLALSAANPRFPTKKNSIGRLRVRPIGTGWPPGHRTGLGPVRGPVRVRPGQPGSGPGNRPRVSQGPAQGPAQDPDGTGPGPGLDAGSDPGLDSRPIWASIFTRWSAYGHINGLGRLAQW